MDKVLKYAGHLRMEIPIFLYMLSSFIKFPVFQNLAYEKICYQHYHDDVLCSNASAYYKDKSIQAEANHFIFASSMILTLPSILSTLILGAVSDNRSIKIPLLLPYVGLVFASLNYIVQGILLHANANYMLISDAIFGACGGYICIISTTLTYGVKTTRLQHRSYRIAGVEGAIGLGGTLGYVLSGTIREAFGYAYTFLFILILISIAFFYVLILAKEEVRIREDNSIGFCSSILSYIRKIICDFYFVLTKPRAFRNILALNLIGLGCELFIFAGLMDIQFSYMRYKLGWGDKAYGWFSGLSYGLTTLAILILYPFLRSKGVTDGILGCAGMVTKIASLIMLAFLKSEAMAYSIAVVTILNRFVSTGFRVFISSLLETDEQGKIFSVISLLDGVTSLCATSMYNMVYPKTLDFFPGFLFLLSAALLIFPIIVLFISDRTVHYHRLEVDSHSSDEAPPSPTPAETSSTM
ncbi:hypothetical protein WR25_01685 [Diploscapter pachys]|uniref:Major facilitator superfamily (MFS) profile domain-containing protein n=1 Tax=Diploscapter pachys TaxID=2018661 RepID=A0A2A2JSQ5_9BILA|nr:hypothetical protein WR25_01685 [Diploscapter pachys]